MKRKSMKIFKIGAPFASEAEKQKRDRIEVALEGTC
jgi:hypothetical protein